MLHVHAVIPRLGLGNGLLPWARAEVFSHRFNVPMLAPFWFKPMIGPFLRRETDKRLYWLLFQPDGYVRGTDRFGALWRTPRIPEPENWFQGGQVTLPRDGYVRFQGLKPPHDSTIDYFRPLWGYNELLRERLREICRPGTLAALREPPGPFIGVHMRRGDLAHSLSDPRNPIYSPPDWFVDSIRSLSVSEELKGIPIKVMTNGDAGDRELFAGIPNLEFVNTGNAAANILFMAQSLVFVGTGYSTFSRWISFLGGMPTFFFPGYVPPDYGTEIYCGPYDPRQPLSERIKTQIAGRRRALLSASSLRETYPIAGAA
jgi:hypothetical protein